MKNNKGFTLIEILGTVTILGILTTIATVGTLKYLNQSREKAYMIMSQSIYEAAENCMIDNKCKSGETIKTNQLIKDRYLDRLKNPIASRDDCSGNVYIKEDYSSNNSGYKKYVFDVTLTCDGININNNTLRWPEAKKESNSNDVYY